MGRTRVTVGYLLGTAAPSMVRRTTLQRAATREEPEPGAPQFELLGISSSSPPPGTKSKAAAEERPGRRMALWHLRELRNAATQIRA